MLPRGFIGTKLENDCFGSKSTAMLCLIALTLATTTPRRIIVSDSASCMSNGPGSGDLPLAMTSLEASDSRAMAVRHCLICCTGLISLRQSVPHHYLDADHYPIMRVTQVCCFAVAFAQIFRSGRAQKLSQPKEGRTRLPNGNRTSGRTQRGKDRSREDAQRPQHKAVDVAPRVPQHLNVGLRYRNKLALTPDWSLPLGSDHSHP